MKLRKKLFGAWIAYELVAAAIALPAFAGLSHHVSFSIKPQVFVQQVDAPQGVNRFLVASNAPFAVLSQGAVTELSVSVSQNGVANGQPYGSAAQMPGEAAACNMPSNVDNKSRIYTSQDKTAARRGSKLEQSVLVEISYDADLTPNFEIVTMDSLNQNGTAYLAMPCQLIAS